MDLRGNLVRLRAPVPEDAPFIAEYVSLPEVSRTLDAWAQFPYSVDLALDWIGRHDPGQVNWAIDCLEDGAFIGCTGLRELNFRNRNCQWGIWIGPPARWNRGYGTEACRLATSFAFRHLGMEKVYLKVYQTNPGGRRAYEKAGYRVEGTLPRDHWWDGGFTESYMMAAYRDDPQYAPGQAG
ncbi:MAG: GNAT family N-acetyltransferase [Candidatus Dormibacteraeota bacterium]|nr:GNAT family N-acetyltransferase [Candidatus Dormibacteraeota bacterium]